jgi:hypothetical protein
MAGFPLAGTYRTPERDTSGVMEAPARGWDGWSAHDDRYVTDGGNVVVCSRVAFGPALADQGRGCEPPLRLHPIALWL